MLLSVSFQLSIFIPSYYISYKLLLINIIKTKANIVSMMRTTLWKTENPLEMQDFNYQGSTKPSFRFLFFK